MILKRTILSLCLIVGSVMLTCCTDLKFGADFLDKAPDGGMNKDSVFASRVYAERAVAEAYFALPFGLPYQSGSWGPKLGRDILECITDLGVSTLGWNHESDMHYYNGQYNSADKQWMANSKYSFTQEHCWESVRAAWIVIENIDAVPDMDETLKKRRKAEMKMVIAVHYTDMFRHFGGLPIIDKVIKPGDETYYPRATVEQTVAFITRLCDEAAADLPWKVDPTDGGRFTKAGALACKIRVLLFAASPVFNDTEPYLAGEASSQLVTWYGDYQKSRWEAVISACEEFFRENTADPYMLVNTGNPREDFRNGYFNRGNNEILISTRCNVNRIGGPTDWMFQTIAKWGSGNSTLNYLEMFPKTDGTPADNDWSKPITFQWPKDNSDPMLAPGNPFANRDPRMYETLVVLGDRKIGGGTSPYFKSWINGDDYNNLGLKTLVTGTNMRKFMFDLDASTMNGKYLQWPWMRLSEIYLSYAEALNEVETTGLYGDKYTNLQEVRKRVGMPEVPGVRSMTKEEFRKTVLLERCLEFGFEEVRWFDLVRWKMKEEFTKTLYQVSITLDSDTNMITLERQPMTDRYWKNNFSPKWYFSAIPLDEVQKGLVQNPGW